MLNKFLYHLNERWVARGIHRFLRRNNKEVDLLITFDPTRLTVPQRFKPTTALFLSVDNYTFTFYGERDLCRNVDAIITVSEQLSDRYRSFHKPTLTIGHSISTEEFSASPPDHMPQGYGLYVGAIDDRVDHERVKAMLLRFPQVPFLFIGQLALPDKHPARSLYLPGRFPNMHLLGVKPFKELKSFIAGSRFCLAPRDVRSLSNTISQHKTFQYLALGKPLFSSVFSEYLPIGHLLYMENDTDRSLDQLQHFLDHGEPGHLAEERIAFARTMTYERTFERIERFLETVPNNDLTAPATTARSIFLFSNEPWGDMWYSKHHYAAELAKHHEVYFVNMPRRWGLASLFSWRARTRMTPEGVHVVDYTNTLPRRLGEFVGRWSGRKVMRLRPHAKAVCWSFNPLALQECLAMRAGGAKLIYHTVDPYQAFPEDAIMARSADLMV
ncbi:MAG: hypothetical protein KA791_09920, partial [Flavobacteriales bacterium]|nr:hypothetical protein [Flavobacteriales bacterium]